MKSSQLREFIKNNLLILIFLNSANVFNYFFQLVVGRALTSTNYGIFNSLLSLATITSSPINIFHIVLSRYIAKMSVSGIGQIKTLLIKSLRGMFFTSSALLCLAFLAIPSIKNYLHLEASLPVVLMLTFVCISLFSPILSGMLEGLHRFTIFGFCSVSNAVTRFLGALILVALIGGGVNGAFSTLIIGSIVATIYGFWGLKDLFKVTQEDTPSNLFGEMGRYALPVFLSTSMIMMLGNLDTVLVRHYCTPEEAGLYSVGAILGRVAFILPSTLLIVLFPSAAKNHAIGEEKKYIFWVSFGLTTILSGGIALIFFYWPEQIIDLLFGSKYKEAAPLLQIIGIAMAILGLANVIFSYQLARSEYFYIWILAGGGLSMLVLILFFHETAMTIAKILLLTTGTIFIGTLFSFFIKPRLSEFKSYFTY